VIIAARGLARLIRIKDCGDRYERRKMWIVVLVAIGDSAVFSTVLSRSGRRRRATS